MIPCTACGSHIRVGGDGCPNCGGSRVHPVRNHAAAVLLLGLVACTGTTTDDKSTHSGTTPQSAYGISTTDISYTDTDTTDTTTPTDGTSFESAATGDTAHSGY